MELTGTEVLHAQPIDVAARLARTMGSQARLVAEEQAAKFAGDNAAAALWCEVAAVVTPLVEANGHMELALALLDSIGAISISAYLDQAIVMLGVRDDSQF